MTVMLYCHVTYEFQIESTLYSFPECQGAHCSKHASAKWLSVCLRTKWLWVRIALLSLKVANVL